MQIRGELAHKSINVLLSRIGCELNQNIQRYGYFEIDSHVPPYKKYRIDVSQSYLELFFHGFLKLFTV